MPAGLQGSTDMSVVEPRWVYAYIFGPQERCDIYIELHLLQLVCWPICTSWWEARPSPQKWSWFYFAPATAWSARVWGWTLQMRCSVPCSAGGEGASTRVIPGTMDHVMWKLGNVVKREETNCWLSFLFSWKPSETALNGIYSHWITEVKIRSLFTNFFQIHSLLWNCASTRSYL